MNLKIFQKEKYDKKKEKISSEMQETIRRNAIFKVWNSNKYGVSNFGVADRPNSNRPGSNSAGTSEVSRGRQRMVSFSTHKMMISITSYAKDSPKDERDPGSDST